jgi:sugar transferase (PEP-CTERM system associated)
MAPRGLWPTWRTVALVACEGVLIVGAVALATWIRLGTDATEALLYERGLLKAFVIAVACQISLYYADLYDLRRLSDHRELFVRTLNALGFTSLAVAGLYYWFPDLVIGRGVFVAAAILVVGLIIGWRFLFAWLSGHAGVREQLLIVGTNPAAVRLAEELLARRADLGVSIAGFVEPDRSRVGEGLAELQILGTVDDIPRLVREHHVDRVVVSLADARGKLSMDQLLTMRMGGVSFAQLPTVYEEYTGKIAVENLRPSWFIFNDGFEKVRVLRGLKRATDVSVGLTIGLVSLPFALLASAAIRLTSPGPVLYRQKRVGLGGRTFTIYKFRSMRADAEAATGAIWATPGRDPRVTKVGGFLRRSRIDELPQLWNVLRGDMSLVGPRPERPEFVTGLTKDIPYYGQRHIVRPGLTGWAQVRYAYGATVEDAVQKLQYDLYYIKNMSLALDLYIIFETLKTVLTKGGS